ncbi:MAG: tRNA lysidine(34) synthetase TilS [SAR324 cluster bacterium]|nr:tRNA lysidine(34) synthetase TilS [SAR324 cluster bacterium]
MLHPLERTVLKTVRSRRLAGSGDVGLVAVSGGADSMALLHLLHALRERLSIGLEVVHFDHGLREASGREAARVEEQTEALGLQFHLRRSTTLRDRKAGVQAAARAWRQEECRRLLAEGECRWVATAHQRDDQSETILLKLLRGCHLDQLQGMAWRDGPFIRPLLDVNHETLMVYLKERGVDWSEDPSNRDPHYKRNRVRHELLPLLDELAGGGAARRLESLAVQSEELHDLLDGFPVPEQSAPEKGPHWISVSGLEQLPPLAATTALHRFVQERMPGEVAFGGLHQAMGLIRSRKPAWRLDLSLGRRISRRGPRLELETGEASTLETLVHEVEGWRIEAPGAFQVHFHSGACETMNTMALYNIPAGASLQVRQRKDGDRFHPPWKNAPVKVKDFLRDQHIDLWERNRMPCLVLNGQVIAIYPRFVARGFDRPGPAGNRLCVGFTIP